MAQVLKNILQEYTGSKQPKPGEHDKEGRPLSPYLPDPELVAAVNLAVYLERPLLLKGEPGSGKTRLARAVAYELDLPYEEWHIKSISRARDGLYTYDVIGRLRDAQLAATNSLAPDKIQSITDPSTYRKLGPLGRAFKNKERTVVLIDEIDKADIDFPNDLLLELDERRFFIEETGEKIQAEVPPILFITSNDERDLPNAFLRRCIFFGIEFPGTERLMSIVSAHFPDAPENLVTAAVSRFRELREKLYQDKKGSGKKMSTSELIDWFRVLRRDPPDEILAKLNGKIPYRSVLLKSWDEHHRYLSTAHIDEDSTT